MGKAEIIKNRKEGSVSFFPYTIIIIIIIVS